MKTVFDITEFGAVGDGVTDCTEAIQKAMDAAGGCKGKITVPPGNYNVRGNLKLRGEGISIEGSGAWSYRNDGGSAFILTDENAECLLDISGAFGCRICGMSFNGSNLGKGIHGILLSWPVPNGGGQEDTPNIDGCRISRFSGDGIRFHNVWCFSLRHNHIIWNKGAALRFCGWDGFITDNWLAGNGEGGINASGLAASVTATANRIEWNRTGGIIIHKGNSFNFTGNFFDRTFGPALELGADGEGVNLATVTGNIFRRGGCYEKAPFTDRFRSSHVIMNGCTGCVLTGNTMKAGRGDGGTPPLSPDYGLIIKNCENSIIKDNALHKASLVNNLITENNKNCIIENNIGCLL